MGTLNHKILTVFIGCRFGCQLGKSARQHENHMLVVGHEIEGAVFYKGNSGKNDAVITGLTYKCTHHSRPTLKDVELEQVVP